MINSFRFWFAWAAVVWGAVAVITPMIEDKRHRYITSIVLMVVALAWSFAGLMLSPWVR